MKNRHTTFYGGKISQLNLCGKKIGWQYKYNRVYQLPFETNPTEGKHDFNICNNCQQFLKAITEHLTERFEGTENKKGFPFCCSSHSNLLGFEDFNRDAFIKVPEMTARKIVYTKQHITNTIDKKDYYKIITDYIDYTFKSFGEMPNNCGEPLFLGTYFDYVKDYINRKRKILTDLKADKLIEFINSYYTPPTESKTDINILLNIYQKWLTIFPFEISFFSNLKEHFEKTLPLLKGKPEYNPYLKTYKVKLHTKSSLIDLLLRLTNKILSKINSLSLYEKGLLTEPQKIKLELVLNERKMKLKNGYINNSQNEEQRYRKILKEWFADEKAFIEEITPLLNALPSQSIKTKSDILKESISQYGFFELSKLQSLSESNKQKLIEKISQNSLPYAIAMFDYLGFLNHLEKQYFDTKYKLYREVSKWFDSDKEGRAVKGNISSLLKNTSENKNRYTAYQHKETVIEDYEQLK